MATGVLDSDACPHIAGERNVDPTKSGCPMARVEQGEIRITERIEFRTGSARLVEFHVASDGSSR